MNEPIAVLSGLPESGVPLLRDRLEARGVRLVGPCKEGWDWMRHSPDCCALVPWQRLQLLPADRSYRVVFLRRNLGEIVIAKLARLAQLGVDPLPGADLLLCRYQRACQSLCSWLERAPNVRVLHVLHDDLQHDPDLEVGRIAEHLGDMPRGADTSPARPDDVFNLCIRR